MDAIADLLSRMQTSLKVRKDNIDVPHSKMKERIARIFLAEGYVAKVETHTRMNKTFIRIGLKYSGKKSVIFGLKRVSRPGRRVYVGAKEIPQVQSGFGTAIISTSKGLMTDSEARGQKLGGEVVCFIW